MECAIGKLGGSIYFMEAVKKDIQEADMVLVGIGTEFNGKNQKRETLLKAYGYLAGMLDGKNYFVVTLNTDDLIFDSGLHAKRIVAPCGSERTGNVVTNSDYDESWYLPQWKKYCLWLKGTVNHKLCILELGVGFEYPTVIRFAFEKVAYFNQKSRMYRVHETLAQLTPEIRDRCTAVQQNAVEFLIV